MQTYAIWSAGGVLEIIRKTWMTLPNVPRESSVLFLNKHTNFFGHKINKDGGCSVNKDSQWLFPFFLTWFDNYFHCLLAEGTFNYCALLSVSLTTGELPTTNIPSIVKQSHKIEIISSYLGFNGVNSKLVLGFEIVSPGFLSVLMHNSESQQPKTCCLILIV